MNDTLSAWAPRILSVLRIVAAAVFMVHGSQKLFGFPPSEHGSPELLSLMGFGGILEFFGGALLLVGLFTRPVAFVLSGMMAVAYFMAHAPQELLPGLERRRRGDPLLLRVSLSGVCRPRLLEPRRRPRADLKRATRRRAIAVEISTPRA